MELIVSTILFSALCLAVVVFFKKKYTYWSKKGVPFLEPSIPFGNQENPLNPKKARYELIQHVYNIFKKAGHKYAGAYFGVAPIFVPIDPDLIKSILVKDFSYFPEKGGYYNEKDDPLSAHLFSLGGEKWKRLRTKLTPTFTPGKMKMVFGILVRCGEQMMEKIDYLSERNEAFDSKDILTRFTSDIIATCAFGLECNSFKNERSEFRMRGSKLVVATWQMKLRLMMIVLSPRFSRILGLPLFDRNLTDFYLNLTKNLVKYREDNNVIRNDVMQILLDLKNKTSDGQDDGTSNLTVEEIAAQAFLFFLAGFETSSSLLNYCLFELAQNEEIQDKVRDEITETLNDHDGDFNYECVMGMKYLGQVIDETLRKYPSMPNVLRKSVKDYQIPGTDITLEAGTRVMISIKSLHSDPEYYPDPEKFDPERFSDENKATRQPCVYIPFGEGPRICVGLRFALMQTRVGLALILRKYRIKLNPKTTLPLGFAASSFILQPKNEIFLNAERI